VSLFGIQVLKTAFDFAPYVRDLRAMTYLGNPKDGYHFVKDDGLAIEMEFGEMLMKAVADAEPDTLLEVGSGHGYSTAWLMLGMAQNGSGHLETWDKEGRTPQIWKQIGLDKLPIDIKVNIGDFRGHAVVGEYDFVFHDSEHQFEHIGPDMDKIIPHMSEKGQIWIHDARGTVGDLLKDYFTKKGWNYKQIDISYGMGIASKGEL
jgi:predicted O-methyltransferase YrrM